MEEKLFYYLKNHKNFNEIKNEYSDFPFSYDVLFRDYPLEYYSVDECKDWYNNWLTKYIDKSMLLNLLNQI